MPVLAGNRPIFALSFKFYAKYTSFNIASSAGLAQSIAFNMREMFESKVCTRVWARSIALKDMLLFVGTLAAFWAAHAASPCESSNIYTLLPSVYSQNSCRLEGNVVCVKLLGHGIFQVDANARRGSI